MIFFYYFISISSFRKTKKKKKPTSTAKPVIKNPCHCGYGGYCPWTKIHGPQEDCFCAILSATTYSFCDRCDEYKDCTFINTCKEKPCANCVPSFGSFYCNCEVNFRGQMCDAVFEGESK